MWSSCLGFAVSTSCSLRLSYHPVRLRHAPIGLLKGPFNAFPDPSHFVLLPLESGQQFTDSFKLLGHLPVIPRTRERRKVGRPVEGI
jgi:hypothetical protein